MCWFRRRRREQISILVPFQGVDPLRVRVWKWLHRYWRNQLPDAEIIIGRDRRSEKRWHRRQPRPFSKTRAVNNAFRRSHGDVIVILDADAYLPGAVLEHCARRLRKQRQAGVRSWFVPYRWIFRLTRDATERVLDSDPRHPLTFPTPPPLIDVEGTDGSGWGHRFGAMAMVMPREAFELIGGMDERFIGWGSEDVSFLRALDTLWGKHKNTPNQILHLWHPKLVATHWVDPAGAEWEVRVWSRQHTPRNNDRLGQRYDNATGNPGKMRRLVDGAA